MQILENGIKAPLSTLFANIILFTNKKKTQLLASFSDLEYGNPETFFLAAT